MKIKALLAATALVVAPSLVAASCSGYKQQAMSCADGMTYDSASHSCIVVTG